ncbi:MAG: hypothetical protein ABUL49_00720, partial [bacterium]
NGLDVTHARSFDWYHIRLEPTVDRFSVLARMFSPDIDKAKLGAKEGDKINIGPGSIEVWDSRVVAQAEEEKFSYLSMGSPPGKRWVVNFIAHELTSDYQQFLVPLGRKGKISWVTAEGKPSSEATDIRPFFQPAPSESMRSFVTNIDPREIASYQVSAGHTVEVLFRDIAAEPK